MRRSLIRDRKGLFLPTVSDDPHGITAKMEVDNSSSLIDEENSEKDNFNNISLVTSEMNKLASFRRVIDDSGATSPKLRLNRNSSAMFNRTSSDISITKAPLSPASPTNDEDFFISLVDTPTLKEKKRGFSQDSSDDEKSFEFNEFDDVSNTNLEATIDHTSKAFINETEKAVSIPDMFLRSKSFNIKSLKKLNKPISIILPYIKFTEHLADDVQNWTILDCKELVRHIGIENSRQIHNLSLRSAYESYSCAGEPFFTISQPSPNKYQNLMDCFDYIFYSQSNFIVNKLLCIPPLALLRGNNPTEPLLSTEIEWLQPSPGISALFNNQHKLLTVIPGNQSADSHEFNDHNDMKSNSHSHNIPKSRRNSVEQELHLKSLHQGNLAFAIPTHDKNDIRMLKESIRTKLKASSNCSIVVPPAPSVHSSTHHKQQSKPDIVESRMSKSIKSRNDHNTRPTNIISPLVLTGLNKQNKDSSNKTLSSTSSKSATSLQSQSSSNKKSTIAQKINIFWGGSWASAFPKKNIYKESYLLPNDTYCSSHLALCVELSIYKD